MHACMYVYPKRCVYICIRACMHVHICKYACMHAFMHVRIPQAMQCRQRCGPTRWLRRLLIEKWLLQSRLLRTRLAYPARVFVCAGEREREGGREGESKRGMGDACMYACMYACMHHWEVRLNLYVNTNTIYICTSLCSIWYQCICSIWYHCICSIWYQFISAHLSMDNVAWVTSCLHLLKCTKWNESNINIQINHLW